MTKVVSTRSPCWNADVSVRVASAVVTLRGAEAERRSAVPLACCNGRVDTAVARALYREAGDPYGAATALAERAGTTWSSGRFDASEQHLEEASNCAAVKATTAVSSSR